MKAKDAKRKPPTRQPGARQAPSGVIRADEAYHQDDFLARVGWSRGALRTAKLDGLPTVMAGGRCYVLGADWLKYLEGLASRRKAVSTD